jgi:uncharacterized membrane protein
MSGSSNGGAHGIPLVGGIERARVIWEQLRTSFWLVPGTMSLIAAALAVAAHFGDLWLTKQGTRSLPPLIFVSSPDTARDVISTLLSSMITMTSLVFSITMVVLTLAASQFGPRLIRSFMSSPHTQYVLGVFVMTSVYCLIVLGTTGNASGSDEQQAFLSVSLALLLTLTSIALLVLFLHFLARSIVSETVIERIGREIQSQLDALDPIPDSRNEELEHQLPKDYGTAARFLGPVADGYVEGIEFEALLAEARRADALIGLAFRPGDYVAVDGGGIGVYPGDRCTPELEEAIQEAITIGPHRTPNQDPEFSIRHLVEIAVRALSPGINDPYTAVAVVNQLSAALSRLMGRALPQGAMTDEEQMVRVVCPQPTYGSLVGVAFNQIRQNAAGKPLVYIALLDAIKRVADHTKLETQRQTLRQHLDAITEAVGHERVDEIDLKAILARAERAREAIGEKGAGGAGKKPGSRRRRPRSASG